MCAASGTQVAEVVAGLLRMQDAVIGNATGIIAMLSSAMEMAGSTPALSTERKGGGKAANVKSAAAT